MIVQRAGEGSAILGPTPHLRVFLLLYCLYKADPGESSSDCEERLADHRESPVDSGKDYNSGSSPEGI